MASSSESKYGGTFHNGKTDVTLFINLNEIGFTQPTTPIKTDNSAAEGIVINNLRQKRFKAMYTIFYWMEDRVKQK